MIVHWTQARKTLPRSLDGHGFYLGYGDALSTNIIVHSNLDHRHNFSFDHSRHPYWLFGEMLNTLNKLCPMHFQACQACLLAPCMVLCQTVVPHVLHVLQKEHYLICSTHSTIPSWFKPTKFQLLKWSNLFFIYCIHRVKTIKPCTRNQVTEHCPPLFAPDSAH